MKKAEGDAEGELVEADREAEADSGKPARTAEGGQPLLLPVLPARPQDPEAKAGKERDRQVLGGATGEPPGKVSGEQPEDRHRDLETGHQQAHPEAVLLR